MTYKPAATGTVDSAPDDSRRNLIGSVAETTVPSAVSDGDTVDLWHNEYGQPIVYGSNLSEGSLDVSVVGPLPIGNGYVTMLDETIDDTSARVSSAVFVGDCKKISFMIVTAVDTGTPTSVAYTWEVSPDNSTWVDLDLVIDNTGTDSPVSSVTHTTDTEACCGVLYEFTPQYIRVTATGTGTNGSNYFTSDVFMCYQK